MIPGDQLEQCAACIAEKGEILDDIQQAALFAHATNDSLKRDNPLFFLVADLLPLKEMLPASRHAANPALMPVREHDKGVIPEQLGNGIFVVAQVVVKSVFQPLMCGLEFHQHERQAIHKAHQVCPPRMHLASYPQLRNEQEIVVLRSIPVDDAHRLIDFRVTFAAHLYLDAIFQQPVNLAVGMSQAERAAVARQIFNRQLDSLARHTRVEPVQRGPKARYEHNFMQRLTP